MPFYLFFIWGLVLSYLFRAIRLNRLYKLLLNNHLGIMSAVEITVKHFSLTEELQKQLVEQVELRKKLEREFQSLKGISDLIYKYIVIFTKQWFSLEPSFIYLRLSFFSSCKCLCSVCWCSFNKRHTVVWLGFSLFLRSHLANNNIVHFCD